jgi:DNA-binding response OmpR family regulator
MAAYSDRPKRFHSSARRRQNPMVLLALANAGERARYAAFLCEQGFVTLEASDAADAASLTARFLPEIVVTDIDRQGVDLARRVRGDTPSGHSGIVGLGPPLPDDRQQAALEAGFDVVLETPCLAETLLTDLLVLLADLVPNSETMKAAR